MCATYQNIINSILPHTAPNQTITTIADMSPVKCAKAGAGDEAEAHDLTGLTMGVHQLIQSIPCNSII